LCWFGRVARVEKFPALSGAIGEKLRVALAFFAVQREKILFPYSAGNNRETGGAGFGRGLLPCARRFVAG